MLNRKRPDSDELLRRIEEEERRGVRGKLVIFFGASPGVGKTYGMLREAWEQKKNGRDVVVGIVETHGSPETDELLSGLEELPRCPVTHRGIEFAEFDLDLALKRRPGLLLVDELAHANVEGSRHPKRWQDVEELVDAGIDVFTTLNVQHLGSLNDVVAQVTGIEMRETVPDSIFQQAHEIRLVDLPPDELLERIGKGKVYVPEQARRAKDNFFRRGNLIALREMALRSTADRVDAQMRQYRREHGIKHSWPISDRVLVCLSWSPHSPPLIRAACRIALGLHARWFAAYVEIPSRVLSEQDRSQLLRNLRLAEELGATVATLTGENAADEIIRFAQERNVTKVVVGKPRFFSWKERLFGSFVEQITLKSGEIDVLVTGGQDGSSPPESEEASQRPWFKADRVLAYLAATGMVLVVSLVGWLLFGRSHPTAVVMLYLLGVMLIALTFAFDHKPSLTAAVLSVLAFDFFFVPPYYNFAVADLHHLTTFGVLFFVAVTVSGLTRRVRAQADTARERERWTTALYSLSRELSGTVVTESLVDIGARHIEEVFDCRVVLFTTDATGQPTLVRGVAEDNADESSQQSSIIGWVLQNGRAAGLATGTLPNARGLYLPLTGAHGRLGVLGAIPADRKRFDDSTQRRLLEAFASQVALALERTILADETRRARIDAESEEFRSALLGSVSHELRTPLAAMTGAASTLLADDERIAEPTRRELLQSISDESDRLNQLVGNLLDMSRLESGSTDTNREWHPLEDIVGSALNFMDQRLAGRQVKVQLPEELLLIRVDAVLIERALVHLLENAVEYTPADSAIEINARVGEGAVIVEVIDQGPGIPTEERDHIFDRFYRLPASRSRPGTGLGLSICRAILKAHNGRIWVESRTGGGSVFKLALPLEDVPDEIGKQGLPEVSSRNG